MKLGIHAPKQGATQAFIDTARAGGAELIVWTISEEPANMGLLPDALNIFRVPTPYASASLMRDPESPQQWMDRIRATCEDWHLHSQPLQLVFQLGNEPEIRAEPDVPQPWNIVDWKSASPGYVRAFRDAFPEHGVLPAPFGVANTGQIDEAYARQGHGLAVHCYGWASKDEAVDPAAGASWTHALSYGIPIYITEINSRPTDERAWLPAWMAAARQHEHIVGCAFYIADCPPGDADAPYNVTEDQFGELRRAYDTWQPPAPPPQPAPTVGGAYERSSEPMSTNRAYEAGKWFEAVRQRNAAEARRIVDTYGGCAAAIGYDGNLMIAQGWVETGGFTSTRWQQAHNAAGIGIYSDGTPDVQFGTVERGIQAQAALLNDYYGDGRDPWGVLTELGFGFSTPLGKSRLDEMDGVWAADTGYSAAIIGVANDTLGMDVPPEPAPSHAYKIIRPVDCPVEEGSDGTFSHGGNVPGFYAIDYGCVRGTPIRAAADGTVGVIYTTDWNPISARTGPSTWIDHDNGYSTFSCHMSRIDVQTGQRVRQGDIIGLTGDPAIDGGYGNGAHLHWEIWDTARHVRVKMEDLEAAGVAGPWQQQEDDSMFTVDGHIDDGRLDAAWFGTDAPTATAKKTMPRVKGHGIPDRWEAEFRAGKNLGPVKTKEKAADSTGAVIQYFTNGWIVWYPDGTTSVN